MKNFGLKNILKQIALSLLATTAGIGFSDTALSGEDAKLSNDQPAELKCGNPGTERLSVLAFSVDGKFRASATKCGRFKLCRVADGTVRTFYHCFPTAAAFSADASTLATAGCDTTGVGTINLRRASDGDLLQTFTNRVSGIQSLVFSPSGSSLVAAAPDGRINSWRIADGKEIWSVVADAKLVSLIFSPSGETVIVHCADKTVKSFKASDGTVAPNL